MLVVDPFKIQHFRHIVDEEVAAACILHNLSRPQAYFEIARTQLGANLAIARASGWYSCLPISVAGLSGKTPEWEDRVKIALSAVANTAVAKTPESAATATILRLMHPGVDIFLDDDAFDSTYGRDGWREVIDASPFRVSQSDLLDGQMLFESDEEYAARLFRVNVHYRVQLEAYKLHGFPVDESVL